MQRRHTTGSLDGQDLPPDDVPTTSSGKKKRFRKAYSCGNCRYRKIKCERTFPCHQCELRGIAVSCGANTLHHEYSEADERKKMAFQFRTGIFGPSTSQRPLQSQSQSDLLVESPIETTNSSSDSKGLSPTQATLETLYKTVDSFHAHIAQVEQQVKALQLPSSSSTSLGPYRGTRQSQSTSSVPRTRSRTAESNVDPILEQLKQLEHKVDMIYRRVAMACPSPSDLLAPAPFQGPTISPSIPPKPPEWSEAGPSSGGNMNQNDLSAAAPPSIPMEDLQSDPAITQWLQQETLGADLTQPYSIPDFPPLPYDQDAQPFLSLDIAPGSPSDYLPPQ